MFTAIEISNLIRQGRLDIFYNSRGWRNLSKAVMREQNGECQFCRQRGKYSRAELVHHVKTVRKYPAYAYERYYTDSGGNRQRNLLACCRDCHERIHGRTGKKKSGKFVNAERW